VTGGMGEVAGVYAVHSFSEGMTRLATLFSSHPELRGLQATVDQLGHVDIIAMAEPGVLHDWIHALPAARREKGLFTLHSGPAYEEVLRIDNLTVHVRPRSDPHEFRGANRPADTPRGGDRDAQGMGLVNSGRQSTGDSADPCKYCGIVGSHTSDCPVIS